MPPRQTARPKSTPHLKTLPIKLRICGNSSPPEAPCRMPEWRSQPRPSAIGSTSYVLQSTYNLTSNAPIGVPENDAHVKSPLTNPQLGRAFIIARVRMGIRRWWLWGGVKTGRPSSVVTQPSSSPVIPKGSLIGISEAISTSQTEVIRAPRGAADRSMNRQLVHRSYPQS